MRHLSATEAASYLVSALGMGQPQGVGKDGLLATFRRLGVIQLDPLEPIGTNVDLVAMARVDGLRRGEAMSTLLAGHAFDHWAKERCLLPAAWFPAWRANVRHAPWWGLEAREGRVPAALVDAVLAEIVERGPVSVRSLSDRGRVEPFSYTAWKGTGRMATMAVEILWTRCQVVTVGRTGPDRVVDVPERALPGVANQTFGGDFATHALTEATRAAALLGWPAGQARWSLLRGFGGGPADRLVQEGVLEAVRVTGTGSRTWLAPAGELDRTPEPPDDCMRIVGPLDPLIWDRRLVEAVFGFHYRWEVYTPAKKRQFGWYVVPLLHRGAFVGRFEGRVKGSRIEVQGLWPEPGREFDRRAFDEALARHEAAVAP